MKKVISLLLVCMMMLSMATVVSAAEKVTITVADINATTLSTTDTIIVPVTIDKVPEGQARIFSFKISYDPEIVTFVQAFYNTDPVNEEGDSAMPACKASTGKANSYPIEPTVTGAETANSQGWLKVEYSDSGTNVITPTSIEQTNVFTYLFFTKNEGQKGTAELELFDAEIVDQATNSEGNAYTLSTTPEYFDFVNGSIKLTNTYKVTDVNANPEMGTITSKSGELDVTQLDGNETVTVDVSANEGYELATLTYTEEGGSAVDIKDAKTFTMNNKNVTVNATFKAMDIAINYPTVDGITWENSPTSAPYGSEVTIVPTLANKYQLNALAADGADIFETKKFIVNTVNPITITAEAEYIPSSVQVTATSGTGYTVLGAGAYTEGNDVEITVTPDAGYTVEVTATGIELPAAVDNKYSFTMPANNVAINVVATAIEYDLAATVSVSSELSAAADITFTPANAVLNDTVTVKVMPKDATYSIDPAKVKAYGTANAPIVLTLKDDKGIELKGFGYEYEFTMPADGVVTLAMEGATLSADASLTKVEIGYKGNVGGTETAKNDPFTVSAAKTYATLSSYADPAYTDNYLTINVPADGIAAGASYEVLYNNLAYTGNVALGNTSEDFVIKVTAADGKTEKLYTINVKNGTNPNAGATIEFVTSPAGAVAKGSKVTASIYASNLLSVSATALDLEIALPKDIILNNGDEFSVDVHVGAGLVNTINTITYDETSGILKILAITTDGETLLADKCEVAVVTFTVDPETSASKLTIGGAGTNGQIGNGAKDAIDVNEIKPAELDITADMENVKAEAIEEIEGYVDERNYTVETWEEKIIDLIDDAIEALLKPEVDTPEESKQIVDDFKAAIDALETLDQFVAKISTDDNILNGVVAADYTTEDWAEIEAIVDEAQDNIAASGSREEDILNGYVLDAQAKIAEVAKLAARKAEAQAKIVVDEDKYTDEALADEVATAINEAKAAIAGCTTTAGMDDIVDAFLDETAAPGTATAEREATDKITKNIYTLDALTTTNPEENAYAALESVTVEKAQAEKKAYLGKVIDDTLVLTTTDGENDLYDKEAKAKIEIYELIAQAKIDAATSEAAMNAAIDEAKAKITTVPTVDDAAKDALEKISVNDKSGYDIEDIVDTTADDVNPAKEALYEAAIEAYKAENDIPGDDPANPVILTLTQLQGIIDDTNTKITNGYTMLGDFTCNDEVDIQDPAGTMKYVCNVKIDPSEYIVGAQNILNADLHRSGDGILTVFDVIEIMKLL